VKIKDITLMSIMLAILIVASKISFNIGPIPITLQTFAVAIISCLLKWKRASIVFLAYIIMGLIGIPVFSTGGGFA
jgi:biotin transport system substrate-specific component